MIELFDAFAAGLYLVFGLLLFDLWLRRPTLRGYLFLALAAAGALVVDISGMAARRLGDNRVLVLEVANLVGIGIVASSLLELVTTLGPKPAGPRIRALQGALVALGVVAGVVPSLAPIYLLSCTATLILATCVALRIKAGAAQEARTVARGFLVLVSTLLIDLLMLLGIIPALPGLPILGFGALFAAASKALNDRFDREHRELNDLRHQLERKVLDRTEELRLANARLAEAARTDPLTGLPNRRAFWESAEHELHRQVRTRSPATLLLIDLDHFKSLNDRFGHAAGDQALCHAAATLRRRLRAGDLVARWGGEEMVVLLPDTALGAGIELADELRAALASAPVVGDDFEVPITASIGVAEHPPLRPLGDTIRRADQALYLAKSEGRNRVRASTE